MRNHDGGYLQLAHSRTEQRSTAPLPRIDCGCGWCLARLSDGKRYGGQMLASPPMQRSGMGGVGRRPGEGLLRLLWIFRDGLRGFTPRSLRVRPPPDLAVARSTSPKLRLGEEGTPRSEHRELLKALGKTCGTVPLRKQPALKSEFGIRDKASCASTPVELWSPGERCHQQ